MPENAGAARRHRRWGNLAAAHLSAGRMNTVNSHTVSTPLISGSVTVLRRTLVSSALFLCAALLAACGGGGGGGGGGGSAPPPAAPPLPPLPQFPGALLRTPTARRALTRGWHAPPLSRHR